MFVVFVLLFGSIAIALACQTFHGKTLMTENLSVRGECVPGLRGPDANADKAFLWHSWIGHETSQTAATVFGALVYNYSACSGGKAHGVIFTRTPLTVPAVDELDSRMEIFYTVVVCRGSPLVSRVSAMVLNNTQNDNRNPTTGIVRRSAQLAGSWNWNVTNTLVLSTFVRAVGDIWRSDGFACVELGGGKDVEATVSADWKTSGGNSKKDTLSVQIIEWNPTYVLVSRSPVVGVPAFTSVCGTATRDPDVDSANLQPYLTYYDARTGDVTLPPHNDTLRTVSQWLSFVDPALVSVTIFKQSIQANASVQFVDTNITAGRTWPFVLGTSNRFGQPANSTEHDWRSEHAAIGIQLHNNNTIKLSRFIGPGPPPAKVDVFVALVEFLPLPTSVGTAPPAASTTQTPTSAMPSTSTTPAVSVMPTATTSGSISSSQSSSFVSHVDDVTVSSNVEEGAPIGIIVGCVVGALFLIAVIVAAFAIAIRHKRRASSSTSSTSSASSSSSAATTTTPTIADLTNYGQLPHATGTSIAMHTYEDIDSVRRSA